VQIIKKADVSYGGLIGCLQLTASCNLRFSLISAGVNDRV